jgi:DHA2 family lincomycin resistance protein-like MFS transporter
LVIAILLVAVFVTFLNETFLGVALPRIMEDLRIPASTGQWLNTSYMLTMALVIPLTGYIQQRFSARRIYIFAMSLFSVGTLLGALAANFEILLVARVIQAGSGALIFPLLMTTIMTMVPENHRGRVMGNISIAISVAPALGPAISGLVLNSLNWRWLFWLVLPIAVVSSIIGGIRIGGEDHKEVPSIDKFSVVLSALGFGGFIYGLSGIGEQARGTALVNPAIPLSIGVISLVWFALRQGKLGKTNHALLDLNVFRSRNFSISTAMMIVLNMSLFGIGILTPIYTQTVLGASPLTTGLILLPGGLVMGLLGPLVGNLYDKLGARKLVVPSAIVTVISLTYMVTFNEHTSIWQVFAANLVMSAALGFMFPPLFTDSMASVEPHLYPHASAVVGSFQQVAGAAGTALFVTALTVVSISATAGGATAKIASMEGIHSAFVWGAAISVLVPILAFSLSGKRPAQQPAASH